VPDNSIASIFNGLKLEMLVSKPGFPLKTLRKGVYSSTDSEGNVTTVTVARKIR